MLLMYKMNKASDAYLEVSPKLINESGETGQGDEPRSNANLEENAVEVYRILFLFTQFLLT